ncbi:MAG: outer membrane protein assembly factor BamD [Prevotella ruminicola]|jgi:outer membrane protein assembly factor BamD|uniref:Outer membrane protein assembly factor BamD n=1 Tax=Xylanibacter ruminicola TaxID=839 RepID=A0A928BTC6_XYLRU|nr:outer membrane protein assembly factor BamD [Xylanibacter ruminicola]
MNKGIITLACAALLLSSCASEFNSVYKYADSDYKYEYAKEAFACGKFQQAASLLEELVTIKKGSEDAQECLYMLGMAYFGNQDYDAASETFRKYTSSYPRGTYAELAYFYVGQALYQSAPEPRLDQSPTNGAITAYQQFIDLFPESSLRAEAQARLYELHDKLIQKEYLSAELYYNLGGYFGNINSNEESNYTACIITAQNCLKNYPYCSIRENLMLLIMKAKFELAENSSEEKRIDRYRDAEDECYGFLNEFPESKNASLAEKYINKCKKVIKD